MSARVAVRAVPAEAEPPIRLGVASEQPGVTRWRLILLITGRLVACLWLLYGMAQWYSVVTAPTDGPEAFDELTWGATAALAFFAVADPIAAVGLWLGSLWGGVIWGVTVAVQIAVVVMVPGFFNAGPALVLVSVVLFGFYAYVAYSAGREADVAG